MLSTFSGRTALSLLAVTFIGACGGGGGGGGDPQPPAPTFLIGGTVTGLSGSGLVLQNNGGGNLAVGGNGAFAFGGQLASGGAYSVSVLTQPTTPSQTCTVANGAGSVSAANVTSVAVSCTTNSFTVGATVSGLAGAGLAVINNGGDDRAISADVAFTFATSVQSGASYDVRVVRQPRDPVQRCTVANGTGTVGAAAVTAPAITCVTQHPRYAYALDYNDESISIYAVDGTSGQLRGRGHARVGVRPVDGVGAGNGRFVYILNRGSASVSAFTQDGITGDLTEIAGSPYATGAAADGARRISLHPSNRFLYVTNGPANNIAAFRIDDANGGVLTEVAGSPFAAGSNPYHLAIDGRGAYAYAANRDSGDIYTYRIDANTGALVEVAGSRVSTGAGSGPAVVTLHATGRYAYVASTNAGNVLAFAVNPSTGVLTHVAGGPYGADANPADTVLHHPSGRFLYVRNIGVPDTLGSVSAFRIDMSTGALTAIGSPQAIGANSSYSWMHPTGRFLLIANRGTPLNSVSTPGTISVFSIDEVTGALTPAATETLQPSPFSVSTDSSGRFVYVASATGNVHYSFTMDQTTGALTPLAYGYRTIGRDQPISLIAYSSQTAPLAPTFRSRFAYAANTGANTISAYAINAGSGALTAATPAVSGAGPRAVATHPRGRFALSINESGNNEIAAYPITRPGGALSGAQTLPTAGSAPVALAVSPNGRAVYLAHRLDAAPVPDMLGAYQVDVSTGALSPINNGDFNGMPSLTPLTAVAVAPNGRYLYFANNTHLGWATIKDSSGGYTGDNGNAAFGAAGKSALTIHPSGRFAYVVIGTDPGAVEVYPIDPHTGMPATFGSTSAAAGATPRAIAIEPTGRFAYVANAGSSNVSMYTVNQNTGALTAIGAPVATGANPVAIVADYSGRYVHVLSRGAEQVLTYAINQSTGALTALGGTPAATGATPSSLAVTTDVE